MLVIAGLALVLTGVAVWGLGRSGFRGLPGDIYYESDHVRVYSPIVTCLVLSVLLSGLLWLWLWFSQR
jgi:hypothetical protein